MRPTCPTLAVLLAATLASGCAFYRSNRNDPFDPALVAQLEPGRTSAREAVELLGGPAEVVQLGERSAYRYDHAITKGTGLILLVLNFGHTDTREDRLWLFFDEADLLTHVGSSLQAHRGQYALPWQNIHDPADAAEADQERGIANGAGSR
jgi:outer membrane protein assembly factor BamE (lipoprotein component of BamABCDE complex)